MEDPKEIARPEDGRVEALERIIRDTLWMACRYAHGRQSYSVGMYNAAARQAIALNVVAEVSRNGEPLFAIDGSYSPALSGLTDEEYERTLPHWFGSDAIPNHCRGDWLRADAECPSSPDGRHQVDTSMESGSNNCFHCAAPMGPSARTPASRKDRS